MVLKCSKEQLEALHRLFAYLMQRDATTIPESMGKDLMRPIFIKLNNRVNSHTRSKRNWNLIVTDLQAKVYYTFFYQTDLMAEWPYEHYIIQAHLTEIKKQLAYIIR